MRVSRAVSLRHVFTVLLTLVVMAVAAGPASAAGDLLWANQQSSTVGHSDVDGTSVDQSFITGTGASRGVAVDGAHVYWVNESLGSIGRAGLNGTGTDQHFIDGAAAPWGVAVDGAHVYWTNAGSNTIGRANLDGSGADEQFIVGANGPGGVAVDDAHVYWTNVNTSTIGRADLDGTNVDPGFIAGAGTPFGVAVDGAHVYWGNIGGGLGRADLDGSGVDQHFAAPSASVWGVAVDSQHVYWSGNGSTIGRAAIDGTNPDPGFITGASGAEHLAINAAPAETVSVALDPSSLVADGTSTSTATATVTDPAGQPVSGHAVTITSSGAQDVGPVTAGPSPGTYVATITATMSEGSATITGRDTSVDPPRAGTATLNQTSVPQANGGALLWADQQANTVGRANVNGSSPDPAFISGADSPRGVAVDAAHVYWVNYTAGTIGRSNLDGTGVDQSFITGASYPYTVAVDGAHVYWTSTGTNTIGRADLGGTNPTNTFINGANGPAGLAVDADHVYWTNLNTDTIGRAAIDGSAPDQTFIMGLKTPYGLAVDAAHVYWASLGSGSVGRANLDGSSPDSAFLATGSVEGVAVDHKHLYWSNGANAIGRALLDGTSPDTSFVTGLRGAVGLAVAEKTVSLSLNPGSITADGSSTSTGTFTIKNSAGGPVSNHAVTITSSGTQDVGPVTAGPSAGTYVATITSTTSPGTATITATDTSVSPHATDTATLTQTPPSGRAQTITFPTPTGLVYGGPDVDPRATSDSGLPVKVTSLNPMNCTIVGGMLHLVSAGRCGLRATQTGDAGHDPATPVSVVATVAKAPLTQTASSDSMVHGDPVPAITPSYDGFVNGDGAAAVTGVSCSTTATSTSPARAYPTKCAGVAADYNITHALGKMSVTPRPATLTYTGPMDSGSPVLLRGHVTPEPGGTPDLTLAKPLRFTVTGSTGPAKKCTTFVVSAAGDGTCSLKLLPGVYSVVVTTTGTTFTAPASDPATVTVH